MEGREKTESDTPPVAPLPFWLLARATLREAREEARELGREGPLPAAAVFCCWCCEGMALAFAAARSVDCNDAVDDATDGASETEGEAEEEEGEALLALREGEEASSAAMAACLSAEVMKNSL